MEKIINKLGNTIRVFWGEKNEEDEIESQETEFIQAPVESKIEEKQERKPLELSTEEIPERNDGEDACQTVFINPKNYSDCRKIANYIKNDKMVTLNLEYLDNHTAQRVLDFLGGAVSIKGASFHKISEKVYTAIPKDIRVHYEEKSDNREAKL